MATCKSCNSDRCGNHAACARRKDEQRQANTKAVVDKIMHAAETFAAWETVAESAHFLSNVIPVLQPAAKTMLKPIAMDRYNQRVQTYARKAVDLITAYEG